MCTHDPIENRVLIATSKKQAFEWGLVLISQGIASTILPGSNSNQWLVKVDPTEYEQARHIITLYELENTSRPTHLSKKDSQLDLTSILWGLFMLAMFSIQQKYRHIEAVGIGSTVDIQAGEWWRLFTATMLHADVPHLLANLALGVPLLGLAMGRFGPGLALLLTYVAAICGNFISYIASEPHRSALGASGIVFGALGLVTGQWLVKQNATTTPPTVAKKAICGSVLIFAICGVSPGADVVAHATAWVIGIILGAILALSPTPTNSKLVNLASGTLYTLGLILPWHSALKTP